MNVYALVVMIAGIAIGIFLLRWSLRKHKKNGAVTAAAVTILLAILLYHKYLLGNSLYLYSVSDGFSQFLPIYKDFVNMLAGDNGISFWNFSIGFGAEQSYIKFFYPTNLIPILSGYFWNETAMMIAAAWMQVLKMVLSAFFMALFLKKLEFRNLVCCNAGVLYALCGTLIVRGHWWLLGDECYIAAFILWAAECYYRNRRWQWIPVSIALLSCSFGLYYLYLYGLELLIYATVRYIYDRKPMKGYFKFILCCGGFYLLGILMASVVLFDYGRSLVGTARYVATKGYAENMMTIEVIDKDVFFSGLVSLFDVNTSGVFYKYTGALNYLERPILYCGLACLFLVPQSIFLSEKRTGRFILGGIFCIGIYMVFPAVTDVLNMFIKNEELGLRSYRMSSLWIIIFLIVIAAYGLECGIQNKVFNKAGILFTGVLNIGVYAFCVYIAPKYGVVVDFNVCRWVFMFLIIWTVFFMTVKWDTNKKIFETVSLVMFMGICILEAGHSARTTLNVSAEYANQHYEQMKEDPLGYYSDVNAALTYLKNLDGSFYRVSGVRTALNPYCSPLYFNIYDSSYYTNINSATYEFLSEVYPESFTNNIGSKYSIGVGDNLYLSSLTGYKYMLQVNSSEELLMYGYDFLTSIGAINIYQNQYALSVGITYDRYIKESEFKKYDDDEQRKILLFCAVLDDDVDTELKEVSKEEIESLVFSNDLETYRECIQDRQKESFLIERWKEDSIEGKVDLEQNQVMVFSIPDVNGWKIYVDGTCQKLSRANIGFMAIELTEGEHVIKLMYQPPAFWLSGLFSIAAMIVYIILIIRDLKYSRLRLR